MSDAIASRIRALLPDALADRIESLDYQPKVTSTNELLLEEEPPQRDCFRIVLAGEQTAGRGRHGRRWASPRGRGIYLSVSCRLPADRRDIASLTLAIGTGIARFLRSEGLAQVALKWPNDLIFDDRKLGGILLETRPLDSNEMHVVAGIGINRATPAESELASIAIGLDDCMANVRDDKRFTATLIASVLESINIFSGQGLEPFLADWDAADWLRGRTVSIVNAGIAVEGVADGIDADGALLLATARGRERIVSGTVRPLAEQDGARP